MSDWERYDLAAQEPPGEILSTREFCALLGVAVVVAGLLVRETWRLLTRP